MSGDPIYLTVFSPNVPNLSLVDMPGAVRVPGDPTFLAVFSRNVCPMATPVEDVLDAFAPLQRAVKTWAGCSAFSNT